MNKTTKIVLDCAREVHDRLTMSVAVTQHWETSIQKFLGVEEVLVWESVVNPGLDVRTIQTGTQYGTTIHTFQKARVNLRVQCKDHSKFHCWTKN